RDEGEPVRLTAREAELLGYLVAAAPRVVSRDELLVEVWGARPGLRTRTVEVTVHTLRTKVEAAPRAPTQLLTVRGEGYRWIPRVRPAPEALREVLQRFSLPRGARQLVTRALARTLRTDDPAAALAVLGKVGSGESAAVERALLLLDTGRLDEAEALLSELDGAVFEKAHLAFRRGDDAAYDAQLAVALEQPDDRGRSLVRLGVALLDRGRATEGYDALSEAAAWGQRRGDASVEAAAYMEIAMYRAIQGHLEAACEAARRTLTAAIPMGSTFVERLVRDVLAFAHRGLGQDEPADLERRAARALASPRLEEPGVSLFRALERRLAGDRARADQHLREGVASHQRRPNPPDFASVVALRASWAGDLDPEAIAGSNAFLGAMIRAAHGMAPPPALDLCLEPRLVAAHGPWPTPSEG
ncbi:MAG: helix-turn-helix domain-containing protein, partial [Myxococcota bacterium]